MPSLSRRFTTHGSRCNLHVFTVLAVTLLSVPVSAQDWPPTLPDSTRGTATVESKSFLTIPAAVEAARGEEGAAPFIIAKTPPRVELAYHRKLGTKPLERRLWSSWGDICLARDGRVYCGIGDHHDAVGGDARCFIYQWDPRDNVLRQVVDMNRVIPPKNGRPAWSKVHAQIVEGADGGIYFSCTLNDGNRARLPDYKFDDELPGGQIYRFDPQTGKTSVFASLPPRRCTATALLDTKRNIWWCNLEAGEGNALWGLDMKTKQPVFQSKDGLIAFNRNFALARDGSIYFNGEGHIGRFNPATKKVTRMNSSFPDSPGMRCSTRESSDGHIYGITHRADKLFRYTPAKDELKLLGPNWLNGSYTTVCLLSPDERYLYYLPGSHGKASKTGTPVIQYDIASGRQKVLAFLADTIDRELGYVPGGTYGVKISPDGGTLFVNFNGHAADRLRPEKMRANGFGLCAFAAIHIPESER